MAAQYQISGIWYSKIGSTLNLIVTGSELTGWFSRASNPSDTYVLHGSVDPDQSLSNRALSFSVSWIKEGTSSEYRSVTSYTGQYHRLPDSREVINTIFLLQDESTPQRQYASTMVHYDNFSRDEPTMAEIEEELKITRPSHNIPPEE